jgi:hypothetical protein
MTLACTSMVRRTIPLGYRSDFDSSQKTVKFLLV